MSSHKFGIKYSLTFDHFMHAVIKRKVDTCIVRIYFAKGGMIHICPILKNDFMSWFNNHPDLKMHGWWALVKTAVPVLSPLGEKKYPCYFG